MISNNQKLVPVFEFNGKQEYLYSDMDAFQEIRISSLAELLPFTITEIGYSYRGQANSEWPLKTSIERFFENKNIKIAKQHIEEKILNKYKSHSAVFSTQLGYDPRSLNDIDSLVDIQHYGGPTRLLDFTSSFNVALFFATFNNVKTDCAIYCVRNLMINSETFDINDMLENVMVDPSLKEKLPPRKDKSKLLYFHNPAVNNARIKNQNGYFLYAGSVETPFEEALAYSLGANKIELNKLLNHSTEEKILRSSIIKLVIPKELSTVIQKYLNKSNISSSILFPDYHGCIMSLYETDTERF